MDAIFQYTLSIRSFWLVTLSTDTYKRFELESMGLSIGIVLGTNGINVAHELGHRQNKLQRTLAKILVLPSHYMHFYIEYDFGQHANAATPEDLATARLNQSVYSFVITATIR